MRAIQGIFLNWQKFNRTPAFAQRVLFAAEPRVDQAQNTKSRSPFRLLPDSFLLDGARSGEPRAGFVLVLGHTSDHTSITADDSRTASAPTALSPNARRALSALVASRWASAQITQESATLLIASGSAARIFSIVSRNGRGSACASNGINARATRVSTSSGLIANARSRTAASSA